METITKVFNVYDYTELSESAKEKVREWYLDDDLRPEMFTESIDIWLSENFKNSELKVQYSLNYCQGDGLNIYGKVYLDELYEKVSERPDFNLSEKRTEVYQVGFHSCLLVRGNSSELALLLLYS